MTAFGAGAAQLAKRGQTPLGLDELLRLQNIVSAMRVL
jgi:hypothetical protein